MGRLGFEPKTNRLKAECSTAELATHERITHTVSKYSTVDSRENDNFLSQSGHTQLKQGFVLSIRSQYRQPIARIEGVARGSPRF
jgi:hypothetical protein